jgi:site-specific DNA recombinase
MNAVIYARVSTQRQEKEETIDAQISAVKERIISDQATLIIDGIYSDEGYSGSIMSRPALDRLIKDSQLSKFDAVYVYDYGRLSRDLTNLMLIKDDIEKKGATVLSLHERISGDEASDRFTLQIMGAVHEYEKKKISQRFHNGKMHKAKSGKLVGYNAPYGYRYNKETGLFYVYEPEAIVVRMMYEWVVKESMAPYGIIRRLHELGIMPQKEKREYWSKGPIDRILRNETYIGLHHFNKSESVIAKFTRSTLKYRRQLKTGRRVRDRNEWIPFKVPIIINQETFDKAQEQLKLNAKFKPGNRKYDYLLTGLLHCPCGSRRNGDGPSTKKYYRCMSRHKNGDLVNTCKVGGLNVPLLDSMIWKKTKELLSDPSLIREHAAKWIDKLASSDFEEVDKIKKLNSELKKLDEEQLRYTETYGKEITPLDIYEKQMAKLKKERRNITTQIDQLSLNRGMTGKIDIEELAQKAKQTIGKFDFEQKKFIVERVIDKIIASPSEVTVWGSLLVPAYAGNIAKVKYEPNNSDTRDTTQHNSDREVGLDAKHWHSQDATIPFDINFFMPPLDKRTRGYTPRQIEKLKKTADSRWR